MSTNYCAQTNKQKFGLNELFTASVITALSPLLVAALLLRVICGFRAFLGLLDKLYVEVKVTAVIVVVVRE